MTRSWLGLSLVTVLASLGVSAQSNIYSVSLALSGEGNASGMPGLIGGHLNAPTLIAGNSGGAMTQVVLANSPIVGRMTSTNFSLIPANDPKSVLYFRDTNPSLTLLGRTGTAELIHAGGWFAGATGMLTYTLTCTLICPTGTGTPTSQIFEFSFTADGFMDLPVAAAEGALPSIAPDETVAADGSGSGSALFCLNPTANGNVIAGDGSGSGGNVVNPAKVIRAQSGGSGGATCPNEGSGSGSNVVNPAEVICAASSSSGGAAACPNDGAGSGSSIVNPAGVIRSASGNSAASGSLILTPPWLPVQSTFSASATCPDMPSSCWMTVPTGSGTLPPFTNTPVEVDMNFGTLPAGVYPANVSLTVTPSGQTAVTENVPFTLLIGNGSPVLSLSETGVAFGTVGGFTESPAAHTIYLTTSGAAIPYTATASTLSGGTWLTATEGSLPVPSGAEEPLSIAANPAGLAPGVYFGRVDIDAPAAAQPLQSIEVTLTVADPAGSAPILSTPLLSTTGVTFVTTQGVNPPAQPVTVSMYSVPATTIFGQADADDLSTWLTSSASAAAVQAGRPITQTLAVNAKGLAPGVYTGTLYETVPGTAALSSATVLLVVTPPAGTTCTPTQLLPVLTNLGANFEFAAGLPASIQAQVVDDCGNPLTAGAVQASFSTGDPAVTMTPIGGGLWAGTWEPLGVAGGPVTVGINAASASGLTGVTSASGTLDPNPTVPVINPGGIVNAAGLTSDAPLAPGEFISIFGSNLGPSTAAVSSVPYPPSLGGTQVLLNGQPMPLQVASSTQINAVVPYGATVNGFQELLVEQNGAYALPEPLVGAAAAPASFTLDQSGTGAGAIVVVEPNGTGFVASATQPATAGDVLEIYCAGLGVVSPVVDDGTAAPLTPPFPETISTVTVSIGGQNAQVPYAGLAPGFAGLYQVDAIVPAGVTGANVPVILSTSGFSSTAVTMPIQ